MKLEDISLEKYQSGELFKIFPCLKRLENIVENDSFHNKDSVYSHTLKVARNIYGIIGEYDFVSSWFDRRIRYNRKKDLLVIAAIFHDTGKEVTYSVSGGKTSCRGHEEESYRITKELLEDVEGDPSEKRYILEIVKNHALIHPFLVPERETIDMDFERIENSFIYYPDLLLFSLADIRGSQLISNDLHLYNFMNNYICSRLGQYFTRKRNGKREAEIKKKGPC